MRDIRKGEELVLGPKVPLQIRDMCNNTNMFGLGLNGFMRDDRSDRESGKYSLILIISKNPFSFGLTWANLEFSQENFHIATL